MEIDWAREMAESFWGESTANVAAQLRKLKADGMRDAAETADTYFNKNPQRYGFMDLLRTVADEIEKPTH